MQNQTRIFMQTVAAMTLIVADFDIKRLGIGEVSG